MIDTATSVFHKLLGEASDDLERVTLQSPESLHVDTTQKTNIDVLVPRHRVRNLHGKRQQMVRRCWSRFHRHRQIVQASAL